MNKQEIADTASAMVAPGKGLLAMDESNRTCNKRFEDVGLAPTEEDRRAYRELILTTPGLGTAISGRENEGSRRFAALTGLQGSARGLNPRNRKA